MSYYGAEAIRDLSFQTVQTDHLSSSQNADLDDLLYHSIAYDFPNRSVQELTTLTDTISGKRENLNRNVGGGLLRKGQRYAHETTVIAFDKSEKPVAYLSTADNASSRRPFPLGRLEIEAKLRINSLINKRWHWFGMRAVDPALINAEQMPEKTISVVD